MHFILLDTKEKKNHETRGMLMNSARADLEDPNQTDEDEPPTLVVQQRNGVARKFDKDAKYTDNMFTESRRRVPSLHRHLIAC